MRKELPVTIKFKEPRKAEFNIDFNEKEENETKLVISGVNFYGYHDQDCCERVYADFEGVKEYKEQVESLSKIDKIEVKSVKDAGFVIFVYNKDYRMGIFVACYNEQNGYYSDQLTLVINDGKKIIGDFDLEKIDNVD